MDETIDSSLFREIGNTLETIGKETLLSTVSSLKTALARRAAATSEGQAVASENITKFLPILIVGVVVFFVLKHFFGR